MSRQEQVDDCGCVLERNEIGLHMKECPLHAAAPDLLAACEQFVRIAEDGRHPNWARYMKTGAGEKMRAAIKKARGE